jgi:hypothetical protein
MAGAPRTRVSSHSVQFNKAEDQYLIRVPSLNLSQVNLLARCIEAKDTLLPIVGSANGPITPDTMRTIHSASFEFAQSEKSATTFRLEVKFNQDQGAIESGSAQFRWFKIPAETTSTHKATLQLGMIDFHRYNNPRNLILIIY